MAPNVFEGGRRIVKLVSVVAIAACGVYLFFHDPYVPISYSLASFRATPEMNGQCPPNAKTEYRQVQTRTGKEFALTLCFEFIDESNEARDVSWKRITEYTRRT